MERSYHIPGMRIVGPVPLPSSQLYEVTDSTAWMVAEAVKSLVFCARSATVRDWISFPSGGGCVVGK